MARRVAVAGHLFDMARSGQLASRAMEQDIRFCEVDGRRVAYATIGEGPLLVFSARWITHLEDEWELTEVRRFFEELAATHRVVRYDRIGVGLSARELPQPPTVESEARVLRSVLDASVGDEQANTVAGSSPTDASRTAPSTRASDSTVGGSGSSRAESPTPIRS